jgi:hypothetical protein
VTTGIVLQTQTTMTSHFFQVRHEVKNTTADGSNNQLLRTPRYLAQKNRCFKKTSAEGYEFEYMHSAKAFIDAS